jgi:hypothetical protein
LATAPSDRSSKSVAPATGPRFHLAGLICRAGSSEYWNAVDGRSGRAVALRVADAGVEDAPLHVAALQRERALAERLGPVGLLRGEVPHAEGGRIVQAVSPEPAGVLSAAHAGNPVAMLHSLIGVGDVIARVHARGAWHGAFSADSCLLGRDGRVVLTGFAGDGDQAEARRAGIAGDIADFARTALQLLEAAGGATPRVSALLGRAQRVADGGKAPPAMAEICAELRESLDDTFPLPRPLEPAAPAAVQAVGASTAERAEPLAPKAAPQAAAKKLVLVHPVATAPRATDTATTAAPVALVATTRTGDRAALQKATVLSAAIAAAAGGGPSHGSTTIRAPAAATSQPGAASAVAPGAATSRPAPTPVRFPTLDDDLDVPPPRRRVLPAIPAGNAAWIGGFVIIAAVLGLLLWNRGGPPPRAASTVPAGTAGPAQADRTPAEPVASAPTVEAAVPPGAPAASATRETSTGSAPIAASPAPVTPVAPPAAAPSRAAAAPRTAPPKEPAASSARGQVAVTPARPAASQVATAAPAAPNASPSGEAASGAAPTGRAGQLVRDGEAALAQLDAAGARASFEEALRLAPGSQRARDGLARARRLEGVAAVAQDAGDAAIRGDVARAVQGYAQAAAAVPESKAIQESLRAAQAAFGDDEYGRSLAAGYEALGAGRLEEARAAFGRAERARPGDPAGRRGMSQTLTAIRLREEAAGRRNEGANAAP